MMVHCVHYLLKIWSSILIWPGESGEWVKITISIQISCVLARIYLLFYLPAFRNKTNCGETRRNCLEDDFTGLQGLLETFLRVVALQVIRSRFYCFHCFELHSYKPKYAEILSFIFNLMSLHWKSHPKLGVLGVLLTNRELEQFTMMLCRDWCNLHWLTGFSQTIAVDISVTRHGQL